MEVGYVIFGMKHKKKQKKTQEIKRGCNSSLLEQHGGLEGFQTAIHSRRYMAAIY
jgi:hypothetical protein